MNRRPFLRNSMLASGSLLSPSLGLGQETADYRSKAIATANKTREILSTPHIYSNASFYGEGMIYVNLLFPSTRNPSEIKSLVHRVASL